MNAVTAMNPADRTVRIECQSTAIPGGTTAATLCLPFEAFSHLVTRPLHRPRRLPVRNLETYGLDAVRTAIGIREVEAGNVRPLSEIVKELGLGCDTLRILVHREEGTYFAACLDLGLMGDGETKEDAMAQLSDAIAIQAEATAKTGNRSNLFPLADDAEERAFDAATAVEINAITVRLSDGSEVVIATDARE